MASPVVFAHSLIKNQISEDDLCDSSTLRSILDLADIPINYCNADRVFLFSNTAHSALHGLVPSQVIGRTIADIIGTQGDEAIRPYYERAMQGEHVEYEIEISYKIGTRYIRCIYNPVTNGSGIITGWVAVTFDLTEQHRLEKILKKSERDLRIAKEKAEAANIAKSEFLANMSHELRTPLNAIIGLLEILSIKELPYQKQAEYLKVMKSSSSHLMQLINDLLDVSKLEAMRTEFERIPFDLDEIIDEIVSINALEASQKGLELSFHKKSLFKTIFLGDALRLRQVLLNLIGNAVKFTQQGKISVELDYREGTRPDVMDVEITITDTGIGIPEHMLESVFNKFTQADSSVRRHYGGTGLGLSISKMLVEAMDGKILLKSAPGQGSRFTIKLPLPMQKENHLPGHLNENGQEETGGTSRSDLEILLVEDNEGNILVATALLEMHGYHCSIARDGKEALTQLKQKKFDLVLMDIQMPELDGLEVTRQLRSYEKENNSPPVPIVGVTANAFVEDKQRCLEAGMDDYLSKPFNADDLVGIIDRFAAEKKAS